MENKQYRELNNTDTIQPGDEVWEFGHGSWGPVSESEYGQLHRNGYWKMRRPLTCQKTYRMMEIGETIKKGDEWSVGNSPWEPVTGFVGGVYRHADFKFRRRINNPIVNEVIEDLKCQLVKWEEACRAKDRDIDRLLKGRDAADIYIAALEKDLSFYAGISQAMKTYEEVR